MINTEDAKTSLKNLAGFLDILVQIDLQKPNSEPEASIRAKINS